MFNIQIGHGLKIKSGIYKRPITKLLFSMEAQQIGLKYISIK
jgi:hypothetical protein